MLPGEGAQQTQDRFTCNLTPLSPGLLLSLCPRVAVPGWEPAITPGSSPPPSAKVWRCLYLVLTGP